MHTKNICREVASDDYISYFGISNALCSVLFYALIYLNYFGKLIVLITLMVYIFLFPEI